VAVTCVGEFDALLADVLGDDVLLDEVCA